ncbi:MAG: hypothetical protein KDB60_19790, partial [Propionibacteriaceae bacterium]|nr:hypothetical protein [Propionibacteriaceae bacterium]
YTLTQIDVDAGHVANEATASGTPPAGLTPPTATDNTDVPLSTDPAISLDKQVAGVSGSAAGDLIDYTFVVVNTGNVTLTGIVIDDPLVGSVTCPTTTLAPGEPMACSATYTLTQADVDSGHVANDAMVTGTDPHGTDVQASDNTDTPLAPGPALSLVKTGTLNGDAADDTISYEFLVTNTGNVTLTGVVVNDPLVGPVSCPATTLAPGASTTCTATYVLTQ